MPQSQMPAVYIEAQALYEKEKRDLDIRLLSKKLAGPVMTGPAATDDEDESLPRSHEYPDHIRGIPPSQLQVQLIVVPGGK